ncbi:MAG: rod-binding protein [Desulfamplus sp.]|nr:rod-binding protein [Desulfamplus sp.]
MDISLDNKDYLNNISKVNNSDKANTFKAKKDEKALKEACQGFEEVFLNTMMKSMRATLPEDPVLGKSQGMDIFTSMHDQYLVQKISKSENATGIGEYLYRQLQDSL